MNSQSIDHPPDEKKPNINKIVNKNLLIIDGALIKGVAEIKDRTERPTPGSSAPTTRYSVFVIDDEPEYTKMIKTTGDFSLEFDVTTYEDPTLLLNDVSARLDERKDPDLFVINPDLASDKPGVNLLQALLDKKNFSSAVLAISRSAGLRSSLESAGVYDLVTILGKPFNPGDLLPAMRKWAQVGREKRVNRGRSNLERPVFLSFSGKDDTMAGQICKGFELRDIGVWYTRESMDPGDEWRIKVSQGLAQASVFIALISDSYPKSIYCQVELGIILDRLKHDPGHLRVIPVLYNSPTTALEDPQVQRCRNQQEVRISDEDWLNGFQRLLSSVRKSLNRGPSNQS